MIETPTSSSECARILSEAGMSYKCVRGIAEMRQDAWQLTGILNELEALRALATELAASETWQRFDQDSLCIFCGISYDHRPDCLVERAKRLVKKD